MTNPPGSNVDALQHLGEAFLAALRNRDFDALGQYFHPNARSRLLITPGLITPVDAAGVVAKFRQWFGAADHFEMNQCKVSAVGDSLAISYAIRIHEDDGWFIVEQQTYSELVDDRIQSFDLLCSGFRKLQ